MTRRSAFIVPILVTLLTPTTRAQPAAQPKAMAADADPAFEVATIKPHNPDRKGFAIAMMGRNFTTTNTSLDDLVAFAYGLHSRQIMGGLAWLETDKYDLLAEPDVEGKPNSQQLRTMVRKLIYSRA